MNQKNKALEDLAQYIESIQDKPKYTLSEEDFKKMINDVMYSVPTKGKSMVVHAIGEGAMKMIDEAMKKEVNRLYGKQPE